MSKRNIWSRATRLIVVKNVLLGKMTKVQAAKHYRVSVGTVYRWLDEDRKNKNEAAKAVDVKSMSQHPNIKEARLLLDQYRDLDNSDREKGKKQTLKDLLALMALHWLEGIP